MNIGHLFFASVLGMGIVRQSYYLSVLKAKFENQKDRSKKKHGYGGWRLVRIAFITFIYIYFITFLFFFFTVTYELTS